MWYQSMVSRFRDEKVRVKNTSEPGSLKMDQAKFQAWFSRVTTCNSRLQNISLYYEIQQ